MKRESFPECICPLEEALQRHDTRQSWRPRQWVGGGEEIIGEKKLRINFTICERGRWERSKSIFKRTELL